MRTILLGSLLAVVTAALPARAGDRERALAVIEQAIKAHGGADGLARAAQMERTGRGVMPRAGGDVEFTSQDIVSLPDRVRLSIRLGQAEILTVMSGDKGWQKPAGGSAVELRKDQLEEYRGAAYVWWLATLAPLQKADFGLATAPDARVNGRDAAGVRALRRGQPEVALYFDKQSGLLVKVAQRTRLVGVPVEQEYVYSDHKEFNGVKLAGKEVLSVNGKKMHEVRYTDCKFLSKIEDSTFARP